MTVIRQQDLIDSIADALQYMSYYHPLDYVQAVEKAYHKEQNPAAKDAMAQILINSRMSAEGHRPICQDTGIVTCFVKIGMEVQWDKTDMTVQQMVDEGTRRAYLNPDNPLRASIVADPNGARKNTKDNTPSVVHIDMVPGNQVEVMIAAKGGGSENKSKMAMLNPSDDIVEWVTKTLPTMGAGWCPPGMLGIGIGGTAEKAAVMAKESLMDPVDIQDLIKPPGNVESQCIGWLDLFSAIDLLLGHPSFIRKGEFELIAIKGLFLGAEDGSEFYLFYFSDPFQRIFHPFLLIGQLMFIRKELPFAPSANSKMLAEWFYSEVGILVKLQYSSF